MKKIRTLLCIILAAVTALGAGCTPRPGVSAYTHKTPKKKKKYEKN